MEGPVLQKLVLRNLDPNLNNIFVVAIIIAKQRVRKFPNAENDKPDRAVWNFTVRDSPRDYINVTLWGTSLHVENLSQKFQIGDVVDIINPRINIREINTNGERFHPLVTSPFSLTLSERSDIMHHPEETDLNYLLHLPTKPVAGFVPLSEIQANGSNIQGVLVDILAAVRRVDPPRSINTRNGDVLQVRTVVLSDHTATCLKFQLWDADLISFANSWNPNETIIFATDLRIKLSVFERCYIANTSSRTVITTNPNTQEARALQEYIKENPMETEYSINAASINNVMNIRQVHERTNALLESSDPVNNHFCALLYVLISNFDLDGCKHVVFTKCSRCKSVLRDNANCELLDCIFSDSGKETLFDIPVDLSDHTATLLNCRLAGDAAESALACNPREFLRKDDTARCRIKWMFLLQRCTVRITVAISNNKPKITIVALERANMYEVAQRLPVY